SNPTRIGGYFSPGGLRNQTKVGNLLYVADCWNGFEVFDVANPSGPALLGVFRSPGDISHQDSWGVVVRDNLAYLAAGYGGIQIVDVTNPSSPTLITQYSGTTGGTPFGGPARVIAVELDRSTLQTVQSSFENVSCGFSPPTYANYDLTGGMLNTVP